MHSAPSEVAVRTQRFWQNCSKTHIADPRYYKRVRSVLPLLCELHLQPSFRVLDVGCGDGELTEITASYCAHVDAFDISPKLIESAKLRSASNVTFDVRSVDDLGFLVAPKYDAIFAMGVFVTLHGDAFASAVSEISRRLKPKGVVITRDSIPSNGIDIARQVVGDYHAHYRSGDAYLATFGECGLSTRRAVYLESFPNLENYFFVFERNASVAAERSS